MRSLNPIYEKNQNFIVKSRTDQVSRWVAAKNENRRWQQFKILQPVIAVSVGGMCMRHL
jgi:hypothetical protein